MKTITSEMIEQEKQRMYVEQELFGRLLLWPENERFWNAQKPPHQLKQRLLRAVRQHWPFKNAPAAQLEGSDGK